MNKPVNSDIFATALRQTMKTEYERITTSNTSRAPDNAFVFSGDLSHILDKADPSAVATYDPESIVGIKSSPMKFISSYSNTDYELPKYPNSLMDEYFRFFFDYERNSEEAKSIILIDNYTVDDLIDELKLDIFIWIATELLFLPPEEYTKSEMAVYCDFVDKKPNYVQQYNILHSPEGDWRNFNINRKLLTERIKSFPMPPHYFRVYMNSKIKKSQGKIDPLINFFTDTNAYKQNSLEDYYRLKTNIIGIPVEEAKKSLYKEQSLLLNVLVNYYTERVYGFQLVNCLIDIIANKKVFLNSSFPIGLAKIVKSNNLFFSKSGLFDLVISNPGKYIPLFKAIEVSFQSIARKTLDNFVNEYLEQSVEDPLKALEDPRVFIKLLGKLSELFIDLSARYRKKHERKEEEKKENAGKQSEKDSVIANTNKLSPLDRICIMENIADPTNIYSYDILSDLDSIEPLRSIIMGTIPL